MTTFPALESQVAASITDTSATRPRNDCARKLTTSECPGEEVVDSLVFAETVNLDIASRIAWKREAASFS
jgi:hypothetical protein